VHGGNRLGANSLLDTLIFGRRSGQDAAARAKRRSMPEADYAFPEGRGAGPPGDRPPRAERAAARPRSGRSSARRWDRYVAVFRDEQGLRQAQQTVERLKQEAKSVAIDDKGAIFNQDLFGAVELGFNARQRRVA